MVELIVEDGILADTKLIAEPWDAAGLYQVGRFPFGRRWSGSKLRLVSPSPSTSGARPWRLLR